MVMKRLAIRRPGRSGFTLVELLVVIGVLVILVALVTPRIIGTQRKADINLTKTQIGAFKGALDRYHVDMKEFPSTEQGLGALVKAPTGEDGSVSSNWDEGGYLNSDVLPKDPWGNDYQYAYPPVQGKGEYPDIWSFGPDGIDSTGDEITSWTTTDSEEEGEDYVEDIREELEPEPSRDSAGSPP